MATVPAVREKAHLDLDAEPGVLVGTDRRSDGAGERIRVSSVGEQVHII